MIGLVCPPGSEKAWTARVARTLTRAEYPGTAVEWHGVVYEVRDAAPLPDGGTRYRLAPWEEGHAIRRLERYDAVTEEIRQTERRDHRRDRDRRRLTILLAPLAGLAPAEIQKKWERGFGAPAVGLTIASAAALLVAGFLGLVGALMAIAGATLPLPIWLAPPAPVALYLAIESGLRLASAVGAGEPMGTLAAALGLALWQAFQEPTGSRRGAAGAAPPDDVEKDARRRDLARVLEPALALLPPADQEILARRFDFDPIKWGRRSAWAILAAVVLNAAWMFGAVAEPGDVLGETLWSLPGLYLGVEQIRRLRTLARGLPAGSVLGAVVRRFTRDLLA